MTDDVGCLAHAAAVWTTRVAPCAGRRAANPLQQLMHQRHISAAWFNCEQTSQNNLSGTRCRARSVRKTLQVMAKALSLAPGSAQATAALTRTRPSHYAGDAAAASAGTAPGGVADDKPDTPAIPLPSADPSTGASSGSYQQGNAGAGSGSSSGSDWGQPGRKKRKARAQAQSRKRKAARGAAAAARPQQAASTRNVATGAAGDAGAGVPAGRAVAAGGAAAGDPDEHRKYRGVTKKCARASEPCCAAAS